VVIVAEVERNRRLSLGLTSMHRTTNLADGSTQNRREGEESEAEQWHPRRDSHDRRL